MRHQNLLHRGICFLLLLAMLVGYLPIGSLEAKAIEDPSALTGEPATRSGATDRNLYPTYPDIAYHYVVAPNPFTHESDESYTNMGGMTFISNHAYYIRTTEDKSSAYFLRTHLNNQKTGNVYFDGADRLGEGKAMTSANVNGKNYIFVATGKTGADGILLINIPGGETISLRGGYTLQKTNGTNLKADGLAVLSVEGKNATLLIRSEYDFYTATMDATVSGDGILVATPAFSLTESSVKSQAETLLGASIFTYTGYQGFGIYGMDYDELGRLYLSVTVNCSAGILVYTDVAGLISSGTADAHADPEESIIVAGSGYESYRVQDITVEQGVVYYNSRQRWVTSQNYRGDICHLLDTDSYRTDRMEAFRESATYRICGTGKESDVFMNYQDGANYKIKIVSAENATDDQYMFGFESDAQGYWYIRSGIYIQNVAQAANLYITAEDDGTISLKPKEEGNPNQLWLLRYTENKNETTKKYAIHCKADGRYLTNGKSGNDIYNVYCNNTNPKTFVLHQVNNIATLESYLFDYELYKMAYPEVLTKSNGSLMTQTEAKEYWNATGKALGHVVSPYFDPVYYLKHNGDVRGSYGENNYAAAYDHFVKFGYWEGRQGSLYFSAIDYISRDENKDAYKLYFPEKEKILYHFNKNGLNSSAITARWSGSDEFSVKELAKEYDFVASEKVTVTQSDGTQTTTAYYYGAKILREYIASLILLQKCETIEEFYDLVFDAKVYSHMNRTDLSKKKLDAANIKGNTYEEQLRNHWNSNGRTEGRTAGFIFNPSYYMTRYPDQVGSLANAYTHYFYTGRQEGLVGSFYISMSTESDLVCQHPHVATARYISCTTVSSLVTFCAKCHKVVNRIDSPALTHKDSDGNGSCDLCNNPITESLLLQNEILGLEIPGWDNVLIDDLSAYNRGTTPAPSGTYYLVQKNKDGIYRIFDPMSQSRTGTIAATQVYEVGGRIVGADPDMAVKIHRENASNNEKTNQFCLEIEDGYYLFYNREPNRIARKDGSAVRNIALPASGNTTTLSFNRSIAEYDPLTYDSSLGSNNQITTTLQYWLAFEQMDGEEFFEWSLIKSSRDASEQFFLYSIVEDQVHTDGLYSTLRRAVSFIPYNNLYESDVHSKFQSKVKEAKNAYLAYNGIALTGSDLTNKEDLQASLDLLEREILDLIGILEINLQNSTVSYFGASMYNWNEDEMNALTAILPDAKTKGFFFESANNKVGSVPFSTYDNATKETVYGISTYAQMYSIYSGLVTEKITESTNNPPFHDTNVVAGDYWSEEEIENAKEVYTNVEVPFVYKDGYYTLNSDMYGVFFEGEPTSNTRLSILEKPISYYWSQGYNHGAAVAGHQDETLYSFRKTNNYVTAFQPFAKVTEFSGTAYPSDTSSFIFGSPVDSYIMDGVAYVSATNPSLGDAGRGTAVWGFGMKLNIGFQMTEDGCVINEDGSKAPVTFHFSGDDDVWVYIDGNLVMELGGSHDAIQGDIDFSTGNVMISSEKYDRIRDKNENGYGRNGDTVNIGNSIGTIESEKMYQKNLYTQIFNQDIKEFAADGEHIMTIYYMDRGKGRTNCAIKFNLPQSDTLTVTKEIPEYYGNPDGTLTTTKIPDATMAALSEIDFGFTLTHNGIRLGFQNYEIVDQTGTIIGEGATDSLGHFTLKNGQTARFRLLQFNGQTYQVTEDRTTGRFAQPIWECYANGKIPETSPDVSAYIAPAASVQGEQYGSEIISYRCTNAYTYYFDPVLSADDQYVVMDYGKPIEISVIDNAVFDLIPEEVAQTATISYIIEPLVDGKENPEYTLLEGLTDASDYGTVTMLGNRSLRYNLSKMLDTKVQIQCKVSLTLDDMSEHTAKINIIILPATIMYYETNFLSDPSQAFSILNKDGDNVSTRWGYMESTGYDELQDSGEAGDEVYLPIIDKEQIPSNAFFVDFDGKGYAERYSVDPLYNGYDFDSGNWVTHHVQTPKVENSNLIFPYDSAYSIDNVKGTFNLRVEEGYSCTHNGGIENPDRMYGPEFYGTTVKDNLIGNPVNYSYTYNDYFEIRFSTNDCEFDPYDTTASKPVCVLRISYRDDSGRVKEEYLRIPYEFENGKYMVLSGKLPNSVKGLTMTNFGVRFQHLKRAAGKEYGTVSVDYIYVGPEMGWTDSVNSNYLYFGFDNSTASQLRYNTTQYGNINFDEFTDTTWNWYTPSGYVKDNFTLDYIEGTLAMKVKSGPDTSKYYGPSIYTTKIQGTHPIAAGNTPVPDNSPLHFDPHSSEFIQIRFKVENCDLTTTSEDSLHKLVFYYNYSKTDPVTGETTYHLDNLEYRLNYSLLTEEYQTIRVPIVEGGKFQTADEIIAIGIRFRGLKSKGADDGLVTVDEIFIGSQEALDRLLEPADSLFFDFTDSDKDRIRYSSSPYYGGYNFDDPVTRYWGIGYGVDSTNASQDEANSKNSFDIADGIVHISVPYNPLEKQIRIGSTTMPSQASDTLKPGGYYPWHGSPQRMPLSYPAEKAKYAQVRFRLEDCFLIENSFYITVILYHPGEDGEMKFKLCSSDKLEITKGFVTVTIPIKNTDNIDVFTGFGIAFRNIQSEAQGDVGAIYLDYIYIGGMMDSNPTADSLYFTFDNTESDRERYNTDTYGYLNSDDEVDVHWWYNDGSHTTDDTTDGKVESLTIDNSTGTAEIVALPSPPNLTTECQDFYMDTSSTGAYFKNYLDYKPSNAEIYQVRFKIEGFRGGQYLNNEGTQQNISPYVKVLWEESGTHTSQKLVNASQAFYYSESYLDNPDWVTVTCKIHESARNLASVSSIRVYFGGLLNKEGVQGKITIDYIYIGPDDRPDQVYGYDSHYNNDPAYSDGHSLFTEGLGVKLQDNTTSYTETTFSFKGTGFDLISRTGPSQATIRVEVTKKGEAEPLKKLTINNKGQLELYQIPVVSVQGLDYGEYNVTLWVNKAVNSQYEVLNRGGEFYFDALRIYDPLGNDEDASYAADREAYNFIKEIRNILLDKETFENLSDATEETIEGAVFVDVNSHLVQPDGSLPNDPEAGVSDQFTTVDVATYNGIGPKNEVYLAPGQAVAFNLKVSTNRNITSLDIGAKTIVSGNANLKIGILAKDANGDFTIATDRSYTISSATAQYLEMDITNVQVKSESKYQPMYLVFYNISAPGTASTAESPNANGVISLTDVKVAYNANPSTSQNVPGDTITDPEINPDLKPDGKNPREAPIQMLVDGDTLPATKYFVNAVNETPILEENATIRHTLNLASDISLNYLVATSELSGYDSFYMQCEIPVYNGNEYVGTKVVKLSPVLKGNYYYFTLEGLTAVHMMDVIEAKLVMTADGRSYYSETDSYSIAKYAYAQLAKEGNTTQLKQLCADLLRYGAKAQIHKGYRTDCLADCEMTADQKAYLTDLDSVTFGNTNRVLEDLKMPSILWVGKALNLESKVSLKFVFSMGTYEGKADDLSLRVSYKDTTGAEKTLTLSGAQEYNKALGYYAFTVDSLLAAELRSVVSVQIYHGEAPMSCTMEYSADTYGAGKTGTLLDLCKALFAYSDSAKAYFG